MQCSAMQYNTIPMQYLHYITLRYVTLHYITLHYITLHTYVYIHICRYCLRQKTKGDSLRSSPQRREQIVTAARRGWVLESLVDQPPDEGSSKWRNLKNSTVQNHFNVYIYILQYTSIYFIIVTSIYFNMIQVILQVQRMNRLQITDFHMPCVNWWVNSSTIPKFEFVGWLPDSFSTSSHETSAREIVQKVPVFLGGGGGAFRSHGGTKPSNIWPFWYWKLWFYHVLCTLRNPKSGITCRQVGMSGGFDRATGGSLNTARILVDLFCWSTITHTHTDGSMLLVYWISFLFRFSMIVEFTPFTFHFDWMNP